VKLKLCTYFLDQIGNTQMKITYLLILVTLFIASNVLATKPLEKNSPISINIVELKMGNASVISAPIPSSWDVKLRTSESKESSTLTAKTKLGESVTLLITAINIKKSITAKDRVAIVKKFRRTIESQYKSYGNTKELVSRPVKQAMNDGIGHLYTYVDESLLKATKLPSGESIYASAGIIIIDNILITTTILTNNIDTDNYAKALATIHFLTN